VLEGFQASFEGALAINDSSDASTSSGDITGLVLFVLARDLASHIVRLLRGWTVRCSELATAVLGARWSATLGGMLRLHGYLDVCRYCVVGLRTPVAIGDPDPCSRGSGITNGAFDWVAVFRNGGETWVNLVAGIPGVAFESCRVSHHSHRTPLSTAAFNSYTWARAGGNFEAPGQTYSM
jgi:hypothetical protein